MFFLTSQRLHRMRSMCGLLQRISLSSGPKSAKKERFFQAGQSLSSLPQRTQLAFEMYFLGGYSAKNIAEHLSISLKVTQELLHNALSTLGRAYLQEQTLNQQSLLDDALYRLLHSKHSAGLVDELQMWKKISPEHLNAWQHACEVWRLSKHLKPTLMSRSEPLLSPATYVVLAMAALLCALLISALHFASPHGAKSLRTLVLSDATTIELAPFSQLTSPNFQQAELELAQGAALVSAKHASALTLNANPLSIRSHHGTFEVLKHDSEVVINVISGQLDVSHASLEFDQLTLIPGQQLIYSPKHKAVTTRPYPIEQMALWREGLFWVDNKPLGLVLEQLDRQLDGWTFVVNTTLAEQPISGLFRTDQPKQTLRALLAPLDIQINEYGPWLRLVTSAHH